MKKTLLFLSLFLLVALGVTGCKGKKVEEVSPKDLYYDIERMQIDMKTSILRDFYDPQPFDQLKEQVMEGKIDRLGCIFKIREILKDYKCVHLSLIPVDADVLFSKIAPFQFYCFGNDYHVYYTQPKYQKYLGWKLVQIGTSSVEQARDKLSVYSVYPYETQSGAKYCLEDPLSYLNLQMAGLVQENGKISFTFEDLDGKKETVLCKPIVPTSKTIWYYKALEKPNTVLTHNDRKTPFRIRTDAAKKTVYMQYNSCQDSVEYSIVNWFSDMLTELKTEQYDTIVFDLRYNPGGTISSQITLNNLLYKYREELNKYNLAIIMSGRSYSCSCIVLNDFVRTYPHLKIFGEETGQAVFNYTGVSPNNLLKKLNCYFTFPNQIDDIPELYKRAQEVTHTDIHCGTFPDVPAYESYKDWLNGEDTIYNTIYAYYN